MFIDASVSPAKASRSASRGLIGKRPPRIGTLISSTPSLQICFAGAGAEDSAAEQRNAPVLGPASFAQDRRNVTFLSLAALAFSSPAIDHCPVAPLSSVVEPGRTSNGLPQGVSDRPRRQGQAEQARPRIHRQAFVGRRSQAGDRALSAKDRKS